MACLIVTLICGQNLPAFDRGGTSDPYVVSKLGSESFKSIIVKKTLNPIYNQRMSFTVSDPQRDQLVLEVYDHDRFSRDDHMGTCNLSLSNLPREIEQTFTLTLTGKKASGCLLVKVFAKGFGFEHRQQNFSDFQQQPMMMSQQPRNMMTPYMPSAPEIPSSQDLRIIQQQPNPMPYPTIQPQQTIIHHQTTVLVQNINMNPPTNFHQSNPPMMQLSPLNQKNTESHLFIVQGSSLYRIEDPKSDSDSYKKIGTNTWPNSPCMTSLDGKLYIVQDRGLYRVEKPLSNKDSWVKIGTDTWWECSCMASLGNKLYIVQAGTLYRVEDPKKNTDSWKQIGTTKTWKNATGMTVLNGKLYILQGRSLWRVENPKSNKDSWKKIGTNTWPNSPCIASMDGKLYVVQGKCLYRVEYPEMNKDSYTRIGTPTWPGCSGMSVWGKKLYIVSNGTLYRVRDPKSNLDTWARVGTSGTWRGSTCMTTLDF